MIKEFDLSIFNKRLWVAKDSTYKEVMDKFDICTLHELESANISEDEFNSFPSKFGMITTGCIDKETHRIGWLVLIFTGNEVKDCAHEASHVVRALEEYSGLENYADEYRAYLNGWISQNIYNTMIENGTETGTENGTETNSQPTSE